MNYYAFVSGVAHVSICRHSNNSIFIRYGLAAENMISSTAAVASPMCFHLAVMSAVAKQHGLFSLTPKPCILADSHQNPQFGFLWPITVKTLGI